MVVTCARDGGTNANHQRVLWSCLVAFLIGLTLTLHVSHTECHNPVLFNGWALCRFTDDFMYFSIIYLISIVRCPPEKSTTEVLSRMKYGHRGISNYMTFSVVDNLLKINKKTVRFFPDEVHVETVRFLPDEVHVTTVSIRSTSCLKYSVASQLWKRVAPKLIEISTEICFLNQKSTCRLGWFKSTRSADFVFCGV